MLYALLIADIHQIILKYANRAAFMCRDQKAVLRHGTQQTGGF